MFDIELALVWEPWSSNQVITFTPIVISLALLGSDGEPTESTRQEIKQVVLDNRWRDVWSVRLGGELVLVPELLLVRLGGFWEESPVPFGRTTVGTFDLDKLGFTFGARIGLPFRSWAGLPFDAWIDLAGGYAPDAASAVGLARELAG